MDNKILLGLLAGFLISSCGVTRISNTNGSTTIDYKITEKKIFADSIRAQVTSMEPGISRQSAEKNIEAVESPDPSFYRLTVQQNSSRLSYLPPLETGEGAAFISHSTPFTKQDSYKFKDSSAVYVDFNPRISGVVMKVPNKDFHWKDAQKDTIIAGHKAHLYVGNKNNVEVKAWVTDQFPPHLGVYDIFSKEGFVLAYELKKDQEAPFKEQVLKVYPQKIKNKSKQDIKVPVWNREMSLEQVLKHLNAQNKQ